MIGLAILTSHINKNIEISALENEQIKGINKRQDNLFSDQPLTSKLSSTTQPRESTAH